MPVTRRRLLAYAGAISLLPLAPRIVAAAEGSPRRGGTLRLHLQFEPPILVNLTHTAGAAVYISGKVTEGLLSYDSELRPQPQLATAWKVTDDGLSYEFDLREGVKWHDGQPFTSDDVVFSLNTLKIANPRGRATFANVERIEALGTYKVRLELNKPAPYLLTALAGCESPIVAKHVYGEAPPATHPNISAPIGTGPFKFVEWVRGSHVILDRNPAYWDAPKPYLDRIVVRFISDAAAAVAALEAGEIDLSANGIPLTDIERVKAIPRLEVVERPDPYYNGITRVEFNLDNPYLKELQVRQAIAHSLDIKFIQRNIYRGYGKPLPGPISPDMQDFFDPELSPYAFDVAKAEQLLDQAGFPRGSDGTRFKLTLDPLPAADTFRRTGEYIKQALARIGIAVTLRSQDFATYVKRVYTDRDFDFTFNGMSNLFDPTVGVQRLYWSKNFLKGVPFSNGSHYASAEADRLLEAAAVETDHAKRVTLFSKFQRQVVADLPDFGVMTSPNILTLDRKVRDYFTRGEGLGGNFAEAWLE